MKRTWYVSVTTLQGMEVVHELFYGDLEGLKQAGVFKEPVRNLQHQKVYFMKWNTSLKSFDHFYHSLIFIHRSISHFSFFLLFKYIYFLVEDWGFRFSPCVSIHSCALSDSSGRPLCLRKNKFLCHASSSQHWSAFSTSTYAVFSIQTQTQF